MDGLMRRLLGGALRRAGLERRGRSGELRESIKRIEQRYIETKAMLEQARAETLTWKTRYREGIDAKAEKRQVDESRFEGRAAKLEREYQRALAQLKEREAIRLKKLSELREKVIQANRSVRVGREHLMAVEVKLDLIEGAVNILDQRFRTSAFEKQRREV